MEEELASYLAPAEYDFLQDDEPSQQQEEEQPEVPLAEQEDEDEDERNDQQQDDEDEEEEGDEEERGDREQTQGLQQNTVAYADIVSCLLFINILFVFLSGRKMILCG